jgi:N4-gp56 family major capsid protein
MATTNFARQTDEQKTAWSLKFWHNMRNKQFLTNFAGTGPDSMIQRIEELKMSEKGARAVITLVPDLEGDGVVGDSQLEGNEEELKSADQVIRIDQIRNGNRLEGRMADQKSVVTFRNNSMDTLTYWAADRSDQMAFLTLSGVAYTFHNNGAPRVGSALPNLEFAADVTAPTSGRHFRWDGTAKALAASDTTAIAAGDTPSWNMLVDIKAKAVDSMLRPIRTESGIEVFNVFMTGAGIARLKKDPDFMEVWKYAQQRGDENPLFKGTPIGGTKGIYIDGLNIMEYRHVYNTTGAASGSKWGASSTQDGQRVLLCGAQALGYADIMGPKWVEKDFDYDNSPGISVAKIIGFKKPVFPSALTGVKEDFGVICVDTAI